MVGDLRFGFLFPIYFSIEFDLSVSLQLIIIHEQIVTLLYMAFPIYFFE